jgi:hypothetical protein
MAGPVLAVGVVIVRPHAPPHANQPPESMLVDRIHRTDSTLRIVGLGRAHVGVIGSYIVVLWFCETAGMVRLGGVLLLLTFTCALTAVAYLPWLGARERRLREERADLRRQLGELDARRGMS